MVNHRSVSNRAIGTGSFVERIHSIIPRVHERCHTRETKAQIHRTCSKNLVNDTTIAAGRRRSCSIGCLGCGETERTRARCDRFAVTLQFDRLGSRGIRSAACVLFRGVRSRDGISRSRRARCRRRDAATEEARRRVSEGAKRRTRFRPPAALDSTARRITDYARNNKAYRGLSEPALISRDWLLPSTRTRAPAVSCARQTYQRNVPTVNLS